MNVKMNKKSVVFSNIYDEGTFEYITSAAEVANCEMKITDSNTKIAVSGDMDKFIKEYNKV